MHDDKFWGLLSIIFGVGVFITVSSATKFTLAGKSIGTRSGSELQYQLNQFQWIYFIIDNILVTCIELKD